MVQIVINYDPQSGSFQVQTTTPDLLVQAGMLALAQAQIAAKMGRPAERPALVVPELRLGPIKET